MSREKNTLHFVLNTLSKCYLPVSYHLGQIPFRKKWMIALIKWERREVDLTNEEVNARNQLPVYETLAEGFWLQDQEAAARQAMEQAAYQAGYKAGYEDCEEDLSS